MVYAYVCVKFLYNRSTSFKHLTQLMKIGSELEIEILVISSKYTLIKSEKGIFGKSFCNLSNLVSFRFASSIKA